MEKPMSGMSFKFMSFGFKFRDLLSPREDTLKEVGIKAGFYILDYGCGPGSYTIPAAQLVGDSGKVYALDIQPLAVKQVQSAANKRNLNNIQTILSDCATGLPDDSLDVVLLYDTFHSLGEPDKVLAELHRVLKPDGILSFNDHHMEKGEKDIISTVTGKGLFKLLRKDEKVYNFSKIH